MSTSITKIVVEVFLDDDTTKTLTMSPSADAYTVAGGVMRLGPDQYVWAGAGTEQEFNEATAYLHRRSYNRGTQPVALDGRDPSNSEIEELTAPLDQDDDVFQLVKPDQADSKSE